MESNEIVQKIIYRLKEYNSYLSAIEKLIAGNRWDKVREDMAEEVVLNFLKDLEGFRDELAAHNKQEKQK